MADAVTRPPNPPWDDITTAGKKEVIEYLQANASFELLQKHKLVGKIANVSKNAKQPAVLAAYADAVATNAWATEEEREAARAAHAQAKAAAEPAPAAAAPKPAAAPEPSKPKEGPLFTKRLKKKGRGTYPKPGDKVQVHYTGRLQDGTIFDSTTDPKSGKKKPPLVFKVGLAQPAVIAGWDAAVLEMSVGELAEVTIPPEHAYGKKGVPGLVPPDSTLIFEVELANIL